MGTRRLSILILFLLLALSQKKAHAQTLVVGDSLFQWTALLDEELRFDEIFFRNLEFPCVNKFFIRKSKNPSTEFEMISQSSLRRSYSIRNNKMLLNAYIGSDPFFNLPNHEVVFLNPIPLLNIKDYQATEEKGSGEFICSYKTDELSKELKVYLKEREVSNISINGTVEWSVDYDSEQLLDNEVTDLEGVVLNYTLNFRINSIRFKSSKWTIEMYDELDPFLKESFPEAKYIFQNFYEEGKLIETARIVSYPIRKFVYHDTEYFLPLAICDNKNMDINLYPNPTYGNINLQFRNAIPDAYTFKLYNIAGKELWSTEIKVDSSLSVNKFMLPGFQKGIYLYSVRDKSGKTITSRRLVVVEP